MHNNNSLQNLQRKRDELDRQLKNIERRINAHVNSHSNDRFFNAEFQKEIKKLPLTGSRAPSVDRLTVKHGEMLSKNFVEKSKKHVRIQEVLRRIPNRATNRDIDAIVRRALVRLKRHTRGELMSPDLMTRVMNSHKNNTPQNKKRRRSSINTNSIPTNLRGLNMTNIGDLLNSDPDMFNHQLSPYIQHL